MSSKLSPLTMLATLGAVVAAPDASLIDVILLLRLLAAAASVDT